MSYKKLSSKFDKRANQFASFYKIQLFSDTINRSMSFLIASYER